MARFQLSSDSRPTSVRDLRLGGRVYAGLLLALAAAAWFGGALMATWAGHAVRAVLVLALSAGLRVRFWSWLRATALLYITLAPAVFLVAAWLQVPVAPSTLGAPGFGAVGLVTGWIDLAAGAVLGALVLRAMRDVWMHRRGGAERSTSGRTADAQ